MGAVSMGRAVPGLREAVVRGERVFLRRPVEGDRREFVALRRANRAYLERWEPMPPRGFDAFGDDAFDRELSLARTASEERLLVCLRSDGAMIGRLSINAITRGPLQSCVLGYWLAEAHAGRGYMSEGVALGLRHCFRGLRLHRVEVNMMPSNGASRRVVEKCGFRREGYSARYLKIRGRWADHERWAITKEDWEATGRARR